MGAYVESFERAYRRNVLVRRWDDRLLDFGVGVHGVTTDDVDGGTKALIEHAYWENVEAQGGDGVVHGDSPITRVAYYVDESGAWRGPDEEPVDEESAPDPREVGEPVACFE